MKPGSHGPYVPCKRLCVILDEYMARLGITKDEVCAELAAATGKSAESWARRLYSWYSGESETTRFATADEVLTSLYLIDRWITDLNDVYQLAA